MLHMTMPLRLFHSKWQSVATAGLNFSGSDAFWGDGERLNLSFSPRSAALLFSFGLSIQDLRGTRHANVGQLVTFGFRPTFELWTYPTNNGSLWGRRYMDYFLPLPRNISLCLDFATVVGRCTVQTSFVLAHFAADDGYFMTDGLNRMFSMPNSTFWRLFHVPVQRELFYRVTQSPTWDLVP